MGFYSNPWLTGGSSCRLPGIDGPKDLDYGLAAPWKTWIIMGRPKVTIGRDCLSRIPIPSKSASWTSSNSRTLIEFINILTTWSPFHWRGWKSSSQNGLGWSPASRRELTNGACRLISPSQTAAHMFRKLIIILQYVFQHCSCLFLLESPCFSW